MPRFAMSVLFGLLLGIIATASSASAAEKQLLAGAATSNITPPLGELIVGGWQPIPAKHIHDELHARCLVLDDGATRLAIVLCDNVGIPEEVFDDAKALVAEATGIPASHQLMAATHTHSATTARGKSKLIKENELTSYQTFLTQRIADGVQRAVNQLEPAQIGWGRTEEPSEVFNRRWFMTDAAQLTNPFGGVDRVRMNPPRGSSALDRQAGPIDPEICFVSVKSKEGRPIALLANYSLHYVGGVRSGDVSADYFGYFAKYIEEKLGATDQQPAFVGILSNGTSGDVNNIDFTEKSPKRYAPYEKMQEVAQKVASKVAEAHEKIEFQSWVPLAAAANKLPLKARKPTPEMRKHFEEIAARSKDDSSGHRREEIYAARIEKLKDAPDVVEVPMQVLKIGDLGITAIPFETFAETGLEIKDRSPFMEAFTIELANGSFGYLPTPEQHRYGGYETWLGTNYVEEKASAKIVENLMKLSNSLQEQAK
ncbi:neutral/alkaline non-lysosomal ceramidase N-terminal domain-containing protein [Bremerella sp.]|uniref:neutral/alkaline non-lysosomal ceramidase N-terminal domain-containing protein n=1 Tax=Bremerella sp. TaxID=2795602 RepID=UPI00391CB226